MKNNFCIIPWISMTSDNAGLVRPCCKYAEKNKQGEYPTGSLRENTYEEIWNGENFKKLRQAFLDNKRPAECSSCWDEEAGGFESYRVHHNKYYQLRTPVKNYRTTEAVPPILMDLKLSNVCNFKCRMCDYSYSSLILKEDKEHRNYEVPDEAYYLSNKILGTENEVYFMEQILPALSKIDFTGGEPFVSPEGKSLITKISETEYAKNLTIVITTNGSIFNPRLLSVLSRFKRVNILVSLDDIGDRLEYQRHGAVWSVIKKNINSFKDIPNVRASLHPTINNYNIWDIQDYFEWAEDNNLRSIINVLHGPEYLSIKNLPRKLKDEVWNKHQDLITLQNAMNVMMEAPDPDDDRYLHNFLSETERLDKIRKEDFRSVFSAWSDRIYNYKLYEAK